MKFSVNFIGKNKTTGPLQEVNVDEINTGTLDRDEALDLAIHMLETADELMLYAEIEDLGINENTWDAIEAIQAEIGKSNRTE